jgi:hypothetical protein
MNTETTTAPHAERAHSKRSPSSLGKYAVCPHFKQDDDQPVHPVTLEGTLIHEAIEKKNLRGLTQEQRVMAQTGLDYVDAIKATGKFLQYDEISLRVPLVHDKKGHADVVLLSQDGKTAHCIDFKAGYNRQADAEQNLQQKCYIAACLEKWLSVETITVHIVYVRLQEADVFEFTRADETRIQLEILAVDRRAEEAENFELANKGVLFYHRADPATCTYCVKAGVCPAMQQITVPTAQAYAQARPESLKVPASYDPALISDPEVMAQALVVAGIMDTWVSSVKKHALQLRMDLGLDIPGTTLAHRAGTKTIVDPNTAFALAEKHGVTQGEFMTAVKVSAPELLDIVSSKAEKGKKKFMAQVFEDELRDSGALSIGPETFFLRKSK